MISFKTGGVTVRVDFSFLVFNALVFLFRDSALVLAFYTTCAIHEFGHILALWLTGGKLSAVSFSGAGIRMETVRAAAEPVRRSLAVLLAGPAANLLVFGLMRLADCGGTFPELNLLAAAYNMLPFRCLDGGAVIALFTVGTPHERITELVLNAVRLLIIVFAALAFFKLRVQMPPLQKQLLRKTKNRPAQKQLPQARPSQEERKIPRRVLRRKPLQPVPRRPKRIPIRVPTAQPILT